MLVVLDTNVLVSGLLNGAGYPGKIIDLLLDDRIQEAYDNRILGEYEDVLNRSELHIHPSRAKAIIAYIELSGRYTEAEKQSPDDCPDIDDLPFMEVFITSQAQAIITGNNRHFLHCAGACTPTQFIQKYFPSLA
jgi:putative PIN family toxin of toxin-antitoxin system